MSDSYEVDFGLDLLNDDASLDLDGDGLTNLEEFLRASDPNDATSPSDVFFVATDGIDLAARGSETEPWASIGFALQQVATIDDPRINIFAGTYREDVTLIPGVTLAAVLGDLVIIEGRVLGASESTLLDVEIAAIVANGVAPLLDMTDIAMNVQGVVFRGTPARTETGIVVTGAGLTDGLIESCTFTSLGVGIDIGGDIPVIRRSLFEDISVAGIILRETATGAALSEDTDAASGFNTFNTPFIDGFAIDDRSGLDFSVQNNDWGTDESSVIEASIAGENEFIPFLAVGHAILASALFIVVTDAGTQASITDASVALETDLPDFALHPVTNNVDGVYAYPVLMDGDYTVTVSAPGFDNVIREATLSGGELLTLTVPLGIVSVEPPTPPRTGCYGGATSGEANLQTLIELCMVISLLMILNMGTRKRHLCAAKGRALKFGLKRKS
jgi:hypothetical protein